MFNNLAITYSEGFSEDISSENSISDIRFAVSIDDIDLRSMPRKFLFNLYQISHKAGVTSRSEILLAPCGVSIWKNFGSNF